MADDRRFVRSEKTAEKACDLIAEAAKGGAELVVFSGIVPAGIPDGRRCRRRSIPRLLSRAGRASPDLKCAIEIRAGAQAIEAKVFNIVASGFVDAAMREALGTANRASLDIIDGSPRGISLVIDPSCNVTGEVLSEHEGILYADIDTEKDVEPKQFHDVVGYYNRFDIFNLTIDRMPLEPAHFVDAPAADSATPDHARPGQLENGELSLRDVDGFGALS